MNCRLLILPLCLTFLLSCSFAVLAEDDEPAPPQTIAELRAAIEAVMEKRDLPAVGIAMLDASGPLWVGSLGTADLASGRPADEDTLYRIGSVSKMFVALAVLKLVEEGRLSLDDTVAELAPEIEFDNPWEDSDPVRLVHLLEHTTGWDDIHLPEYAHNDPTPVSLEEALDFHPHSRTSRWKPGTRYSYCNVGPPIAAYIVQKVTGRDFEDYVAEEFFGPMGMDTATFRYSPEYQQIGATLYNNGNQPQPYWHISLRPSGAINASPRDMAGLVRFYLDRGRAGGQSLISESSLGRMESVASTSGARAGQQSGYGLHNYDSRHKQWVYREHNGGVNGGLTEMAYLPEAGAGHAIMINSGDGQAFNEISDLVRNFETRHLDPAEPEAEREPSSANRAIEGWYYRINSRQQVAHFIDRFTSLRRVAFEGDRLVGSDLLGGDGIELFPVSDTLYKSADTGLLSMSVTQDPLAGDVLHWGMRVYQPISAASVYTQVTLLALWILLMASSLLFMPVWLVRRWRGSVPAGATIRVRAWPALAALCVVVLVWLFSIAIKDPFVTLGAPTALSLGILASTLLYPLAAVMGLSVAWNSRAEPMNRVNWWHSGLASLVHCIFVIYFLAYGVIGMRTWA